MPMAIQPSIETNEKVIKKILAKNFQFLADFAVLLEEVDSHLALPDTININN
jgi:hypothetical protein